jgi:hypothetical protein
MSQSLQRRVQELRARTLVRSWAYRQRHHARGAWFHLRRVLADASAAFVIPADDAAMLVAEGYRLEPAGQALEPPKSIVFAPAERVAQIRRARAVPVRLGRELLEAEHLALTPFEPAP